MMPPVDASLTPAGRQFAATCGTCAHRKDGVCVEPRSAWHDWRVDAEHRACYFYNRQPTRLPRIGGGLEEPKEEESK